MKDDSSYSHHVRSKKVNIGQNQVDDHRVFGSGSNETIKLFDVPVPSGLPSRGRD